MPLVVKVTGDEVLTQQAIWMGKLDEVINRPQALVPAIRMAGLYIKDNFGGEGTVLGRKWQNLTDYTKKVRTEAGHGEGPILHRSGQLEEAAADKMRGWRALGNTTYSKPKPYGEGDNLSFVGHVSSRHFTGRISGARVANQFGQNRTTVQSYFTGMGDRSRFGAGYLPPRPFWRFIPEMVDDMSAGVIGYIMQEWQSESGGLATLTGVRPTTRKRR